MAIGELNCPSLDYVYRMTWAEFRIRLFSYRRQDKNEWYKVREVSYQVYVSNWQNPKKKPLTKDRFMPLDVSKSSVTDAMKKRMKEVSEQYKIDVQNGRKVIS